MRTLKDNPSIGVFGEIWAQKTCDLIKKVLATNRVYVCEYTEREALFIDQYDLFIITDFGRSAGGWSSERFEKLNQMREIIYTRSMRTVLFANDDDADVSTSLREAGCRLVRVNNLKWESIPENFSEIILRELKGVHSDSFQDHHNLPEFVKKQSAAA